MVGKQQGGGALLVGGGGVFRALQSFPSARHFIEALEALYAAREDRILAFEIDVQALDGFLRAVFGQGSATWGPIVTL